MNFAFFYDANAGAKLTPDQPVGGQISGGFWLESNPQTSSCDTPVSFVPGEEPVYQTCHRYGAFNTEPRMASYLGIAAGPDPGQALLGSGPHVLQRQLRLRLDRDQADRRLGRPTTASRSSRVR